MRNRVLFITLSFLIILAASLLAQDPTLGQRPAAGAFSAGTSFPLLAPAGAVTAPSYSFSGSAEMGMWRSTTNLLLQNKGVTPGTGRSRVTLGEENFSILALRTENATHGGSIQCFDEASSTMKCRVDVGDGTNTNTTKTEPTFTSFNKALLAPAGTAADPSYSFSTDTNTGIFNSAADTLDVSTGGTSRMSVSATSLTSTLPLFVPVGTGGAPTYSFSGDSDTGMHQLSANSLGFAVGTLGTTFFLNTTTVTSNFNPFQGPTLSASTPTYSFSNDPNTGIFQNGTDVVGISAGGTARMSVSDAAVSLAVPLVTTSTVPTSPSCTGLGTGSAAMEAGSSSTAGTFVLSPTGAPASSGTCSATIAALGTNQPTCVAMAQNVAGSVWEVEPTFRGGSGLTTTLLSFAWDNNGTSLTAGGTYKLVYICIGK